MDTNGPDRIRSHGDAVVLHAYSRSNSGDGLLLDLTLELMEQAGWDRPRIIAFDAAGFADVPGVVPLPGVYGSRLHRYRERAGMLFDGGQSVWLGGGIYTSPLARRAMAAPLLVGMGGGYLRAPGGLDSARTATFHLPQLGWAARSASRTVYLPQSIGPLRGLVGESIGRALRGIDAVLVRDDRSCDEVRRFTAAERAPDLGALAVARRASSAERGGRSTFLLVGRELAGYDLAPAVHALGEGLPGRRFWAVQSSTPGNDDRSLYTRMGVEPDGALADLLAREEPGVVISVRLHGALEAILSGWPAIHLSYERKGWGAFADLGLDEWVCNARDFRPSEVIAQAAALAADPSRYWERIDSRLPMLRAESDRIVDLLAADR